MQFITVDVSKPLTFNQCKVMFLDAAILSHVVYSVNTLSITHSILIEYTRFLEFVGSPMGQTQNALASLFSNKEWRSL